jgi:hypothetical protein
MPGFSKLYIGITPQDFGSEWTYSRTAWEAMTKLELIPFAEVHIEEHFCCSIGTHCEIDAKDIMRWLEGQQYHPQIFLV